jgi:hypothetical protein
MTAAESELHLGTGGCSGLGEVPLTATGDPTGFRCALVREPSATILTTRSPRCSSSRASTLFEHLNAAGTSRPTGRLRQRTGHDLRAQDHKVSSSSARVNRIG